MLAPSVRASNSAGGMTGERVESVVLGVSGTIAPFIATRGRPVEKRSFLSDRSPRLVEFHGQVDPMSCVWRLRNPLAAKTGVERQPEVPHETRKMKSGDLTMKSILTAALAIAFSAASANAGLFGHHKSDCCAPAPSCCAPAAPTCAAPCGPACAPECAAPAPACEAPAAPACCAPAAPTCAAPACAPACEAPAAPTCCAPAAPACCAPAPAACCAPSSCCGSSHKCGGGMFSWFKKLCKRGHGCGHSSCCEAAPSCCAPAPTCAAPCDPTCAAPCGACN
jgi:hypothetical protein